MRGRMLVFDDDAAVADTVAMMGERCGFAARPVSNVDAFRIALRSWRPTHIVVDIVMPKVDGIEILLELAREGCGAAIVIVSGAGQRALDAAHRAATDYGLRVLGTIGKPFQLARFRSLVLQEDPMPVIARSVSEPTVRPGGVNIDASDIRDALARKQFKAVFQPKVACSDLALAGFEALARWPHPTKGQIPSSVFIPAIERLGWSDELTQLIFEDALDWFGTAFPSGDLILAVNISGRIDDFGLADQLAAIAARRGVDPRNVMLELSEPSAMADSAATLSLATRLRLKGFQLSIDDFGAGASSLVELARLPVSELKIDASFIRNLKVSREARRIAKAILSLGHGLGLKVAAEGVEDVYALEMLTEMRCDDAQGYFFAPPMPREDVSRWINQRLIAPPSSLFRA